MYESRTHVVLKIWHGRPIGPIPVFQKESKLLGLHISSLSLLYKVHTSRMHETYYSFILLHIIKYSALTCRFSNDCLVDQFDRPIAGTLLICADKFGSMSSDTEEGRSQQQKLDEVLQHETAHVLGMSGATMPYWRDRTNFGKPYTPRPLIEEEVVCINGETESIVVPAQNTVREGKTKTGVRYFRVVTPTVRNVIANQFDCESATGARLDNNEYYNCIGSHWSSVSLRRHRCILRETCVHFLNSNPCDLLVALA